MYRESINLQYQGISGTVADLHLPDDKTRQCEDSVNHQCWQEQFHRKRRTLQTLGDSRWVRFLNILPRHYEKLIAFREMYNEDYKMSFIGRAIVITTTDHFSTSKKPAN